MASVFFDVVVEALTSLAPLFEGRRDLVLRRQLVIDAHPELRERELVKLESLADVVTAALSARSVGPGPARLAAQAGLAAFRVAFQRWVDDGGGPDLAGLVRQAADELRAVASGS